ncbi:energy transducer TonB [Hahella sp. SMD15-11]|uniref:Energy transducer TonB n=1 Tax=Thermohahella caldifontis TaxID=3142973 RepID=A0AB39UT05_9GAMM
MPEPEVLRERSAPGVRQADTVPKPATGNTATDQTQPEAPQGLSDAPETAGEETSRENPGHPDARPVIPESWLQALRTRIARTQQYPRQARLRRWEGTVTVRFTLDASGQILEIVVEQSSGKPLLDRAALLAIQKATPLPAPPQTVDFPVAITLPVQFHLDG